MHSVEVVLVLVNIFFVILSTIGFTLFFDSVHHCSQVIGLYGNSDFPLHASL